MPTPRPPPGASWGVSPTTPSLGGRVVRGYPAAALGDPEAVVVPVQHDAVVRAANREAVLAAVDQNAVVVAVDHEAVVGAGDRDARRSQPPTMTSATSRSTTSRRSPAAIGKRSERSRAGRPGSGGRPYGHDMTA